MLERIMDDLEINETYEHLRELQRNLQFCRVCKTEGPYIAAIAAAIVVGLFLVIK